MFNRLSRRIIVLLALIIVGSSVAVFALRLKAIQANREMMRYLDAIVDLQATLASVTDAETGQRGYLLTGDESYLRPYVDGVRSVQHNLLELHDDAVEGDLSIDEVAQLSTLVNRKFEELEKVIDLRRRSGMAAAVDEVNTHSGKNLMDSIRTQIDHMTQHEETYLAANNRNVELLTRAGNLIVGAWTILNLAALIWAYRRTNREIEGRRQERGRLQRETELFAVTMEGVRDGVIVTDANGKVTALSQAAERLTGWDSRDAVRQTYDAVFHLKNDGASQKQNDPLEQVRSTGRAAGDSTHSILVRRQGDAINVDYNAARLHESEGKMRGMVLFFREFSPTMQLARPS
jgi:PAS domain S-box-containing protein